MRNFKTALTLVALCEFEMATNQSRADGPCEYGMTRFMSNGLYPSGYVRALAIWNDGRGPVLVAGGNELFYEQSDYYDIAAFNPKTGWTKLGDETELSYVTTIKVFQDDLYAGSSLLQGKRVAKWNGSHWINMGEGLPAAILDLETFDDGSGPKLFAACQNDLYRFNGKTWESIAHFNGVVSTLLAHNGELIVGGSFTNAADISANRIARWNGQHWSAIGEGFGAGTVGDLAATTISGRELLFACGTITATGDTRVNQIAYWDGEAWHALPPIHDPDQLSIHKMTVWNAGARDVLVMALNAQSQDTGDSWDLLYRLDGEQSNFHWTGLGSTFHIPYSFVGDMIPFDDGSSDPPPLYVGGRFSQFPGPTGIYSPSLVRMIPGPVVTYKPIPSDPRALNSITALIEFDNGEGPAVYAGGHFTGLANPPDAAAAAKFNGDSWSPIAYGSVTAMIVFDDQSGGGPKLYAAFGNSPNQVKKWNGVPGNSNWTLVGSGNGTFSGTINALIAHDDGSGAGPQLYATGRFTSVAGAPMSCVAKYNAAVGSWQQLGSGLGGGGTFGPEGFALASFDDGSGPALYVGGRFTTAGGNPANFIARWKGSAGGWSTVGGGMDQEVDSLHVFNDRDGARLIAGGRFVNAGQVQAARIAQWDGNAWSSIGDSGQVLVGNTGVTSMTTFDEGDGPSLFVFSGFNSTIARWNGSYWAAVANIPCGAMLPVGDSLYLGGELFAIWSPDSAAMQITKQPEGGSFMPNSSVDLSVEVAHGGMVRYQWRRNGNPIFDSFGAQSYRLHIFQINGADEGSYDVLVSNDCTTIASEPAFVDVIATCPGDITVDNQVNTSDLIAMLGAWGDCPASSSCAADLDHNGSINAADLLLMINAWGACP